MPVNLISDIYIYNIDIVFIPLCNYECLNVVAAVSFGKPTGFNLLFVGFDAIILEASNHFIAFTIMWCVKFNC